MCGNEFGRNICSFFLLRTTLSVIATWDCCCIMFSANFFEVVMSMRTRIFSTLHLGNMWFTISVSD